jgi:hypothetical protein
MVNKNKTVTAGPDGFTVYYLDEKKHFNYEYHQPLLPHLQKLQLFGDSYRGKRYQQFEQDAFSAYQNRLYKDAVYGLSSYRLEELQRMSIQDKLAIKKTHRLAQYILNRWKQEIVFKLTDDFLRSVFHKSKVVRQLINSSSDYLNLNETNHFEFAELNLNKIDIALKLVEEKILPSDFFKMAA